MPDLRAIAVFCGSKTGRDPDYAQLAAEVGARLAREGIAIVYGGGNVGLMGVLADAALAADGRVIGVIPTSLQERELAHTGLSEQHVVASMHERKTKMSELSDAFIALPGGIGTLEEIYEQWTWSQLGIHSKPCAFLNAKGYFDPIRAMIDRMAAEGFLAPEYAAMVAIEPTIEPLLARLRGYRPPPLKWAAKPVP